MPSLEAVPASAEIQCAMKILLYTDLAIRSDQLFWHRDLGLLTKAFRSLGHDAWLVAHPAKLCPREIRVWDEAGPPPEKPLSRA